MATTGDLNIDNAGLSQAAAAAPAEVTPVPKPKKKKQPLSLRAMKGS